MGIGAAPADERLGEFAVVLRVIDQDAHNHFPRLVPDGEAVGMVEHATALEAVPQAWHFSVASPMEVQNPGTPSHFMC